MKQGMQGANVMLRREKSTLQAFLSPPTTVPCQALGLPLVGHTNYPDFHSSLEQEGGLYLVGGLFRW